MLDSARIECPYCGETFSACIDCSAGNQQYVEDCPVCCRPIELHLDVDSAGQLSALIPRRDDD